MLGKKQKQIEQLRREKEALAAKVQVVDADPYVVIARTLGAEVEGIIASGIDVDGQVNQAIARRREELYKARIDQLAKQQIADLVGAEKRKIDEQAELAASKLAADALQHFLTNEADAYRQQVEARLDQERPATVVREARQQIENEARQRRIEAAKQQLLADPSSGLQRDRLKLRAQEFRQHTKRTNFIKLHQLDDGDPLTMAFTVQGFGLQNLTMSSAYGGSTYRSELEKRKVSGRLIDKTEGIFEAEKDSWLRNPERDEYALRGGQQVRLLAPNPSRAPDEEAELLPCLVKGSPLIFQTLGGAALPHADLELWWVNLGDFKLLS